MSKAVTNLLSHGEALRIGDGGEFLLLEFLHGVLVISQIQLGAHKDDGSVGTMVSNFRIPLNNNKLIHQSLETSLKIQKCYIWIKTWWFY